MRNAGRQGTWRTPLAETPASAARRPAGGVDQAPVQLELGCTPDTLLDASIARSHFGGDPLTDEWSAFLGRHFPAGATFCTWTYSDEGARRFLPYRPPAVFGDLRRFLSAVGYDGPAFFVCETHRWRDVLHAHGLVHSLSSSERLSLQERWYAKRGRARLLPATPGAFPYVCKYALKHADQRGDFIDLQHLPRFQAVTR